MLTSFGNPWVATGFKPCVIPTGEHNRRATKRNFENLNQNYTKTFIQLPLFLSSAAYDEISVNCLSKSNMVFIIFVVCFYVGGYRTSSPVWYSAGLHKTPGPLYGLIIIIIYQVIRISQMNHVWNGQIINGKDKKKQLEAQSFE